MGHVRAVCLFFSEKRCSPDFMLMALMLMICAMLFFGLVCMFSYMVNGLQIEYELVSMFVGAALGCMAGFVMALFILMIRDY